MLNHIINSNFRSNLYASTNVPYCSFDVKLTLFALFNVLLSTMDLGSDSWQSFVYHENENFNWSITTITIVFVPFATRCVTEILRSVFKKNKKGPWKTLKEIVQHLPIFQQVIHCLCLKNLKAAKDQMKKSLKFYKNFKLEMITDEENRKQYLELIQTAADEYVNAEKKYLEIMTEFQQMKLFEAFGESAPQAAFQIAIILQVGRISGAQIFTIFTSLMSLTLGASEILLMMATKDKTVRDASWKTTWFLVFPSMLMVVIPRVLSISLIMSYTKEYFLIILAMFIVLNLAINYDHLKRDAPEVIVGILTNTFASCIVIQEGSGFYTKSGIASSLLHILAILFLCLIVGIGFNVCPDTVINRPAPILHCFKGNFSDDFTMKRCEWPTMLNSNCQDIFQNNEQSYFDGLNCTSLLTTGQRISDKSFVTFCKDIPWWLPLTTASGILVLMNIVSILLIPMALTKVMRSTIHIFRMSKSCFPASLFKPILNQDEENHMDDLLEFLRQPTKTKFKKINRNLKNNTGEELLDLVIRNDHFEVMNIILDNLYVPVSTKMLEKVIKKGSPLMIKMVLAKKKDIIQGEEPKQIFEDERNLN